MHSRRLPLTSLLMLITAALACSPLGAPRPTAKPAPTATLRPTALPVPSDTPLPPDTATVAPTDTPAATETPAATDTAAATDTPPAPTDTPAATEPPAPTTPTLKIVSDLPMTGFSLVLTQGIVNAEMLRLAQANNQACAGQYQIAFEAWDDATAAQGNWDPAVETENANKAAADSSIVVYLGPFNSGAAKLSIPILNQAGPLVMISPSNTNPGLTKPGEGAAGEPDMYYPSGARNYTRVVAADDVQGTVAARFVHDQLGAKTVYVLDDKELYGQQTADAFAAAAKGLGMTVVGRTSFDPASVNATTLMKTIAVSNKGGRPDAIYVGIVPGDQTPALLAAKKAILGDNKKVKLIGPNALDDPTLLSTTAPDVTDDMYASVGGLPENLLPPAGQQFYADYSSKFGGPPTSDPYAIFGYEAMNAALQAIENVCAAGGDPTDRAAVRDAVFGLKDFAGALGTWSFDANGDTTLDDMTFDQAGAGQFKAVAASVAGKIIAIP